MPSIYRQRVKLKVEKLVRKAKKEIIMETPYFLPGHVMRKCLQRAAARGVKVHIILPRHSDLRAIDLLASKYYLEYYKSKIRLHFYIPANLHAKLLLIDGEIFGLGSPNFDYRSFRYQHEVMLFGTHKGIAYEVRRHIDETLENSEEFDHDSWIRRPIIDRILGWVLLPFRHVF
jgi:phosphatidylserine/phosphatidylglycerophosphate/cardiolipin synthase-like enzyme